MVVQGFSKVALKAVSAREVSPEDAVTYFQTPANVGIQYFVVETLDAADEETIHLLTEQIVPRITPSCSSISLF